MSEMVERIARAIYVQQNGEDDWIFHENDGQVRLEYQKMAAAAMEAYRRQMDMEFTRRIDLQKPVSMSAVDWLSSVDRSRLVADDAAKSANALYVAYLAAPSNKRR